MFPLTYDPFGVWGHRVNPSVSLFVATMSCVHYKFSSKLNYDTVTFDGLNITLADLKRQIMGRERLKAVDCGLQITNAQTKEGKKVVLSSVFF